MTGTYLLRSSGLALAGFPESDRRTTRAFPAMHDRDKPAHRAKPAASVGFNGSQWKAVETGCEIDYDFSDRSTAADDGGAESEVNS